MLKAQSVDELFEIAATEAGFCAEATKNYTAKFGRAKSYGEKHWALLMLVLYQCPTSLKEWLKNNFKSEGGKYYDEKIYQ